MLAGRETRSDAVGFWRRRDRIAQDNSVRNHQRPGTILAVFALGYPSAVKMFKRIFLAAAAVLPLYGIVRIVLIAYVIHTLPGPLNSSGDQPSTGCTVQTVEHDCRKLNCVSRVWYCDQRGRPTCLQNKCVCFYGCL
jgi:hypothetical protein